MARQTCRVQIESPVHLPVQYPLRAHCIGSSHFRGSFGLLGNTDAINQIRKPDPGQRRDMSLSTVYAVADRDFLLTKPRTPVPIR